MSEPAVAIEGVRLTCIDADAAGRARGADAEAERLEQQSALAALLGEVGGSGATSAGDPGPATPATPGELPLFEPYDSPAGGWGALLQLDGSEIELREDVAVEDDHRLVQ